MLIFCMFQGQELRICSKLHQSDRKCVHTRKWQDAGFTVKLNANNSNNMS